MAYIPFGRVLSYNADISIIIGARGCGKTFAMRERLLKDWLRDGSRFAVITRHDNSIPSVARDFFGLLAKPDGSGEAASVVMRSHRFRFKRVEGTMFVHEIPRDEWDNPAYVVPKGAWDIIGYFASLSLAEHYKELTYARVKRIVMDEAIIEHPRPRHDYLGNEFTLFAGLVDSIGREHTGGVPPHVYLLGNSGSVVNPYFGAFGIGELPAQGFTWHCGKRVLLYVHTDIDYSNSKRGTVAGFLESLTPDAAMVLDNEFLDDTKDMIANKTNHASFVWAMIVDGVRIGVWYDENYSIFYLNERVPNGTTQIYALTGTDHKVAYVLAHSREMFIGELVEAYRIGRVRFESVFVRRVFEQRVAPMYGVKL